MEESKTDIILDNMSYQKGNALKIVDLESKEYEEKRIKKKQQEKRRNLNNLEKYG